MPRRSARPRPSSSARTARTSPRFILRDVLAGEPGTYKVRVTDGAHTREVTWNVYDTGTAQGEERHPVHRRRHVAGASRGGAAAVEGHRRGQVARQARHRRHAAHGAGRDRRQRIRSSPTRRIRRAPTRPATSRRSMPWASTPTAALDPFDDPKVETIASLVKRRLGMAVGIVTNTEIEDATPAAMVAHTRRRSDLRRDRRAVLCGKARRADGRRRRELPAEAARRRQAQDESDFVGQFRDAGYAVALDRRRK